MGSDCRSNLCVDGDCFPTSCTNLEIDGTETDLNCGGDTCPPCGVGARCEQSGDCASGFCPNNLCAPMLCGNGLQDPGELGVDCGGICPTPCDAAANCSNKRATEAETDTDCGGGTCPRCGDGSKCKVNADCTSNACTNFVCTAPCVGSQCDGGGGAGGAGNGAAGDDAGGAPENGGTSHGGTGAGGAPGGGGTLGSGGTLASGGVPANGGTGQGGTSAGGTSGGAAQGGTGAGGAPAMGGSGGTATGGATMFPDPTCSGCARLSVPLASASDKANYVIFLPNNVNFGSAVMTMRVYRQAGSGGQLKGYIQHSGSPDYSQLFQSTAAELSSLTGWQDVVWNVGAQQASYDKSIVARVGVQITAGGATTLTNPTVVYLDSITVSNAGAGPWNFDNGQSVATSPAVSAASNVMFLNSGDSPVSNAGITWYSR